MQESDRLAAVAAGLFGVPTLVCDGRAFFGLDALPMLRDALAGVAQRLGLQPRGTLDLGDEPLAHLDLNHQMAVLELFAGAARDCGAGVVMVLHDPALAHRFCDQALLIDGAQNVIGTGHGDLDVSRPHSGWSEQAPADWIRATPGSADSTSRWMRS